MSNMINLDAFDTPQEKPASETPLTSTTDVGLVVASTKAAAPKASRSLSEIYSEKQKLVYLIDISGSMDEAVAGAASVEMFDWEFAMRAINENIERAAAAVMDVESRATQALLDAASDGADLNSEADMAQIQIDEPDAKTQMWASLAGLDEAAMKLEILRKGLDKDVYLRPNAKHRALASKLGMVKKMAKRMIEERLAKYPEADILCATFDTRTTILDATTPEAMLNELQLIEPRGGTAIYRAIEDIAEACKASPSVVNLHHIVLVSDGEDGSALKLTEMLPQLKKLGIVLDFIYVSQPNNQDSWHSSCAQAIKEVCDATNGTYTVVTTADEFETKFIAASTRLMLPPASA